jgi:large subunit ribosomal protein L32
MPVPKKRHSNTRTNQRRANWKLKALNLGECPQCHSKILSHHACPICGTYQGRIVLKIKSKTKRSEKKSEEKPKS